MAGIVELNHYPVKGCAGTSVTEALVTPAGLAHDRSFMVVGEDGVSRTQRRHPRLALVRPEIGADGERLTLRAPEIEAVSVAVDTTTARCDVNLLGAPYRGIDQGDAVAGWLSEVLGTPSRLVRVPPEHDRVADGWIPGTSGYADSSPVLLTTMSSLDALNERIAARGGDPVPMDRFRPNIVVDGWDEPYGEDRVRRLRAGEAELGYSKLAIRCTVTLVDQESGRQAGPEPLHSLADHRRAKQGGVAFGVKFAVTRAGRLSVGDELTVTCRGESEL
ncbi:MOSC domain-containing protein [Haloactinomyces albus]|uniref:Uncharacterized protein YcbX n=1 Tax=Haloactinomyces albus TaxID=1352928 RepID=A0AAE4CKI0_9ACTN|nr:MOSC N-terminal beta barrel domain-containing protein [Haloactinomyces albus]MDR7300371.1 uncharacterized protein YcbX [Haloactinomyces albus]